MDFLYKTVVIVSALALVFGDDAMLCPDGHFQPPGGSECVKCSRCPDNQIVRETCWLRRDTVCGIFTEFKPFNMNNKESLMQSFDVEHDAKHEHEAKHLSQQEKTGGTGNAWQTASIVMITLLAVTSVLCVVLVATVCYRCRRDKNEDLIYKGKGSADVSAAEGSYIITRKSSSSSVVSPAPRDVAGDPRHMPQFDGTGPRHVQQFEITEDKLYT